MADLPARVGRWGFPEGPVRLTQTWIQGLPPAGPVFIPSRITYWGTIDRVPFQQADILRNVALLSGPPSALPKNQYSWPLPIAPRPASDLRTFINDTPFQLIGKDLLPFRQKDWPLPTAPRPASDLRTFINDLPFQLIGKDKLPVRQQSWPVPIAPDYSVSLRSFLARPSLPLITAVVTVPVDTTHIPSRVTDWGTWERIPFTAAPLTNLTLSLPVISYVLRVASFAPKWAQAQPDTWITQSNIVLRSAPVVANFLPCRVVDWGYSAPQTYAIADLRRNTALLAGVAAPVQPPFSQDDWPVPSAQRQADRTFQQSFPQTLIGQDRLPVRQQSWPLPVPAAPVNDLRTFIGPPQKQPVVLPFRQSDWPVPIASDFSNALRSIGFRSPALDVVVAVVRPFVQSDWPVPTAQRPAADLRTFINDTPIQLIGKDRLPIRQQDWPLPIAPRPAADLRTYIAQSPIRLIGKDRLPFRQMHWPVPRAHLEFHTLRSIMQGRVIYGGEPPVIPPEPEPPPPEVIHSVRAHADAYYGVFYADEIKGRADFSRAKGSNDEEAAN